MKAIILRSYGSPDVLDLTDTDRPVPATMRCWSGCANLQAHPAAPVTDRSN